jgi:hypothetical protein
MNFRNILLATALLGLLGACKSEVKAEVHCKGQKEGMACVVSQTQGDSKVKVCWDLKVPCKNGTTVTGSGCAEVSGGGKTDHLIPNTALENDEKCDEATGMTMENIKITAL